VSEEGLLEEVDVGGELCEPQTVLRPVFM
jgi:hypothetical protein